MKKLLLTMTSCHREELREHLELNGFWFEIDEDDEDIIEIDEEDVPYVKTILHELGILWSELD